MSLISLPVVPVISSVVTAAPSAGQNSDTSVDSPTGPHLALRPGHLASGGSKEIPANRSREGGSHDPLCISAEDGNRIFNVSVAMVTLHNEDPAHHSDIRVDYSGPDRTSLSSGLEQSASSSMSGSSHSTHPGGWYLL